MTEDTFQHYVVCVWSDEPFVAAEVLVDTKSPRKALHAIEALQLVAPHVSCALHAFDAHGGGRVLSVRAGVWRVHEPEVAQQVA